MYFMQKIPVSVNRNRNFFEFYRYSAGSAGGGGGNSPLRPSGLGPAFGPGPM